MSHPYGRAMAAAFALACAASARSAVLHVSQNTPAASPDGAAWQTAFPTVAAALARSAPGDEIWVGPGTYTGTVQIGPDRAVYGGFVGTETRRDQRRGLPDLSVLRAAPSAPAVAFASDATPATVLDGFTIEGATTVAAVFCAGGSPTIAHNIFRGNADGGPRASNPIDPDGAAGVFFTGSDAVVESNLFLANTGNAICGAGRIRYNTIVANMGAGFRYGGSGAVELTGNIIAGNLKGVALFPESGTARNNCVTGSQLADFDRCGDFTGSNGNIDGDPRFAAPTGANYALTAGSPCVDAAGEASGGLDLFLRPRGIGAASDMGAIEWDGRTWYATPHVIRVATNGSDTNDGASWSAAMATLGAALSNATDGTEIWVAKGEYTGDDTYTLPAFVSVYGGFAGNEAARDQRDPSANATVLSNRRGLPIVTATGGYRVSVLDGVTLRGDKSAPLGYTAGLYCRQASPVVRRCVFTGLSGSKDSLLLFGDAAAPLITDSTVADNDMDNSGPGIIYFSGGSAPEFERNTFVDNRVAGPGGTGVIGIENSPAIALRNNVFARNTPGAYGWMTSDNLEGLEVVNNTFVANTGPFGTIGLARSIIFANNVFVDCPGAPPSGGFNNCYWRSGDVSGTAGVDGNIEADPLFVDAANGDYRLQPGSPCRDAGINAIVRPNATDRDGAPRLVNGRVDIGAYELPLAPAQSAARILRIVAGIDPAAAADSALDRDGLPGLTLPDALLALR